MKRSIKLLSITILLFFALTSPAQVKLPALFGEGMVLQRDKEIPIWGWALPREKITISLGDQMLETRAEKDGSWQIRFKPMVAGGPHTLTVKGENEIVLRDILIGDVWVCSGQSNMAMSMKGPILNSEEEIAAANYPEIRLFAVPKDIDTKAHEDLLGGEWKKAIVDNTADFSAVGYFFGRDLYKEIDVPVGLIGTYWSGSKIESWISKKRLGEFDDFKGVLTEIEQKALTRGKIEKNIADTYTAWMKEVNSNDQGMHGAKPEWADSKLDDSNWEDIKLPSSWSNPGVKDLQCFKGTVWLRKLIELEPIYEGHELVLNLGTIANTDEVFFNGKKVGGQRSDWNHREYQIPKELVKSGANVITVRIAEPGTWSYIFGNGACVCLRSDVGLKDKALAGKWKYKIGYKTQTPLPPKDFGPNSKPTLLFNAMVAPLIPFAIKGVIWYQGEGNAARAYQYRKLLPAMINDWRNHWNIKNPGQGKFPFLIVQLPNYQQAQTQPSESNWAELREAQQMALSLPNTGIAAAIDIGEADDVHPANKQDVGKRLALTALKTAYDRDVVFSGPTFESMKMEEHKARITFSNTGSGLMAKDPYAYVKGFAIAGADKKFTWAKAEIVGDEVVVFNESVQNPVAVRYAWASNPAEANLYNKEGLPTLPFRTDEWKGTTYDAKYDYLSGVQTFEVAQGWANNSVNAVIFRRNSIVTHENFQYLAYYDPDGTVVLAKRKLGTSHWEIKKTKFKGNTKDAHNSISIMVDGKGYLHISWDHHGHMLRYAKSVRPGSLKLGRKQKMTGLNEQKVTYPEFYKMPNGDLLFFYRDGASGNGNLVLNRYKLSTGKWHQIQSSLLDGEGERNAYWQVYVDDKSIVHLSWVWRETGDVATNHDMCYARSKDGGVSWENSGGEAYQLPINRKSAEIALPIPQKRELINHTSMTTDNKGNPVIATYFRAPKSKVPQYHLIYHDGKSWLSKVVSSRETPFSLSGNGTKRIPISRPQILMEQSEGKDIAILIFRDEERGNKPSMFLNRDFPSGNWKVVNLSTDDLGQWEPSYDTELWKTKKVLGLFVQKVEQIDGEGISNENPQMVKVLEWNPME